MGGEQPTWPKYERPDELVDGEPAPWWTSIAAVAAVALGGETRREGLGLGPVGPGGMPALLLLAVDGSMPS